MGFFSRNKEASPEAGVEAPKPSDSGSKREKPDFNALAQQRVEAVKTKTGSKWEGIKKGFAKARDFVLTIDSRTAYRAGQAKDAGVAGAEAVGRTAVAGAEKFGAGTAHVVGKTREMGEAATDFAGDVLVAGIDKTIDTGKALGRGAKATAEFGVGVAVLGVEAGVKGGKLVYEKGRQTAEAARDGIDRGVEAAHNKYTEVRTGIKERFAKAREAVLVTKEWAKFQAEQVKHNAYKALAESFEAKRGSSQEKMAEIQMRAAKVLESRGISREESEPSEYQVAA